MVGRGQDERLPNSSGGSVEQQTGAREAGLGFLKFGDIERRDVKATRFQAGARPREGRRENHRLANRQRVRRVRLLGRDIDPFETGERLRVKPSSIRQQRGASDVSNGGFQMQAARHRNADHYVAVWPEDGCKLPNALGIRAVRKPCEQPSPDAQNIASLNLSRQFHASEFAKFRKRLSDGGRFRTPRLGPKRKNDRQFVEDDRGIFDEHRIGKRRLRRKRNDARAALFEKRLVGAMLLLGLGNLDALPDNMGQLAINYAGTDGARNGGEHGRKVYMKMFRVPRAAHTLERADKMSIRGGTA